MSTRRGFIKSVAALAGLAAVPELKELTPDEKIQKLFRKGTHAEKGKRVIFVATPGISDSLVNYGPVVTFRAFDADGRVIK